jgi:hypothetical protein
MSPAESINSITVGGLHSDETEFRLNAGRIDPYQSFLPSPTNTIGSGFKRSIKPDIVYPSGKQIYSHRYRGENEPIILTPVNNYLKPGLLVACPDGAEGGLDKEAYIRGSSNAAALITRSAIKCVEELRSLFSDVFLIDMPVQIEACLIKAILIHGAEWGETGEKLYTLLDDIGDKGKVKIQINRLIGYGLPDINKSLSCTEQRATVMGFGQLKQEQAQIYEFPLPPSLSSVRQKSRLTITLAYISPISTTNIKYRHSNIWFTIENNNLASNRIESNHNAVKRGTIQHEIFEQENAVPFEDGNTIRVKVNCRTDGTTNKDDVIPYGLIVSLEVGEGIEVPIYEEVRTRIATAVQVQQQA